MVYYLAVSTFLSESLVLQKEVRLGLGAAMSFAGMGDSAGTICINHHNERYGVDD
jgi:hypothetical protein